MKIFYIELTDTFAGNLNYCWVKRFKVEATTIRGAISKLSKETGLKFRNNDIFYKAKGVCAGAIEMDLDYLDQYEIDNLYDFVIL